MKQKDGVTDRHDERHDRESSKTRHGYPGDGDGERRERWEERERGEIERDKSQLQVGGGVHKERKGLIPKESA